MLAGCSHMTDAGLSLSLFSNNGICKQPTSVILASLISSMFGMGFFKNIPNHFFGYIFSFYISYIVFTFSHSNFCCLCVCVCFCFFLGGGRSLIANSHEHFRVTTLSVQYCKNTASAAIHVNKEKTSKSCFIHFYTYPPQQQYK